MNLKYGGKEKFKDEVIKMNEVLEYVKITGFTHCRNVIQATMRIVGEDEEIRYKEEKGTILEKKDLERYQ